MKFIWTTSSKQALEDIKKQIIENHNENKREKIRIKFTKKKWFVAVPIVVFGYPAFDLYINEKYYKNYLFKKNEWKEH